MTINYLNTGPRMSQAAVHAGVVYLSGRAAGPDGAVDGAAAMLDSVVFLAISAGDEHSCDDHEHRHRPPDPEDDLWADAEALG